MGKHGSDSLRPLCGWGGCQGAERESQLCRQVPWDSGQVPFLAGPQFPLYKVRVVILT